MYYVYLLKSERTQRLYIGYTSDLRSRFVQHNNGENYSTKAGRPWKLVYYEAFLSECDARKRELALKDFGKAYGQMKRRLQNSLEG